MEPLDPILHHEIPVIRKIIQDETWLEGERRGCRVTDDDRVVRERVCEVVMRIGQQLREMIDGSITTAKQMGEKPMSVTNASNSADGSSRPGAAA